MSEKYTVIICKDGVGGGCLGFQSAFFIKQAGHEVLVKIAAKDEIFKPLYHLFSDQFNIEQISEDFVIDSHLEKTFVVWPDALFRNPLAFDFKKFNTSLNAIKSQRLLQHKLKLTNKIGLFLNSVTTGYTYQDVGGLATEIAKRFPDKTVYLPILTRWANQDVPSVVFKQESDAPSNLVIEENQDFNKVIDHLLECELTLCADNGPGNISYQTGQVRILLDPRSECTRHTCAWISRWRSDNGNDSIPILTPVNDIVNLCDVLLNEPTTQLLPKWFLLNKTKENFEFSKWLIYKF